MKNPLQLTVERIREADVERLMVQKELNQWWEGGGTGGGQCLPTVSSMPWFARRHMEWLFHHYHDDIHVVGYIAMLYRFIISPNIHNTSKCVFVVGVSVTGKSDLCAHSWPIQWMAQGLKSHWPIKESYSVI